MRRFLTAGTRLLFIYFPVKTATGKRAGIHAGIFPEHRGVSRLNRETCDFPRFPVPGIPRNKNTSRNTLQQMFARYRISLAYLLNVSVRLRSASLLLFGSVVGVAVDHHHAHGPGALPRRRVAPATRWPTAASAPRDRPHRLRHRQRVLCGRRQADGSPRFGLK